MLDKTLSGAQRKLNLSHQNVGNEFCRVYENLQNEGNNTSVIIYFQTGMNFIYRLIDFIHFINFILASDINGRQSVNLLSIHLIYIYKIVQLSQ